jgi:anti-sigma regulatory factor (Ser/Thr protein kinase)
VFERTVAAFIVELRDDGRPFDPTAAGPLNARAESDANGGWGLELVRRHVDDIRYRREHGQNVLRFTRQLVSASADG